MRHLRIRQILGVALLLGCVGETPRTPPSSVRSPIAPAHWMLGCYFIEPAGNRPTLIPDGIELTAHAISASSGERRWAVRADSSALKSSSWKPLSNSRIEVDLGSGSSASHFVLSRSAEGLSGTLRVFGDVASDNAVAHETPVVLRRRACPPSGR